MQPAKVKVAIFLFAYSGNGGVASTIPEISMWLADNVPKMKRDPRIECVARTILCDTPITMTRNRAMRMALDGGFDFVLMLDSDNEPDAYLKVDPSATPFWETAFDFAYDRLVAGKPTIIAAPYCGPPPNPVPQAGTIDHGEVPYLFEWLDNESDVPEPGYRLEILSRNEAAKLRGIYPVAALPTGVCLISTLVADGMKRPLFDYQFNEDGSEKSTTEDVFFTRNASLYWQERIGENVCYACCDSWALHHKVKKVGRPRQIGLEHVGKDLVEPILALRSAREEKRMLDLPTPPNVRRGETLPDEFDDEGPEEEAIHESNGNGRPVLHRSVFGRKLLTSYEPLADDLEAVNTVAHAVGIRFKNTPVRVLVVDPGDGHEIAAILPRLHPDSTIFAYPAGEGRVAENFAAEVASARIRVMTEFDTNQAEGFNFIFSSDGLLMGLLDELLVHLAPDGIVAGCCYYDGDTADEIRRVLDKYQQGPRVIQGTGVWAIEASQFQEPVSESADRNA